MRKALDRVWKEMRASESIAFGAVLVLLLIGIGLDLSDQPIYESFKAWALVFMTLAFLYSLVPATVRCAGDWANVWMVCALSGVQLIVVLVVFYTVYFWISVNLKSDRILMLPPVLTAVWAAVMGWYVHFQATAKNHRTTNAFNLVMQTRTSSEFLKNVRLAQSLYPHGSAVPKEDAPMIASASLASASQRLKDAKSSGADQAEPISALRRARAANAMKYVLNYYEFMAVGIKARDLDEEMIYESIAVNVTSIFSRCRPFVDYVRAPVPGGDGQPLAFEHLEALSNQWEKRLKAEMSK